VFPNSTFFDSLYVPNSAPFFHKGRYLDSVQVALHDLAAKQDAETIVLVAEHLDSSPPGAATLNLDFVSVVDHKDAVHSALLPPALVGQVPLVSKFVCLARLQRVAPATGGAPVEHPGAWNVSLGSDLNIKDISQVASALHDLGFLPTLPTQVDVLIVGMREIAHMDDASHAYYVKTWTQRSDVKAKPAKQKSASANPTPGNPEISLNAKFTFPFTTQDLSKLQIFFSLHKHLPVVHDKNIGVISPPIPLVTAISQPGTFENCLLPVHSGGVVTGKLHVKFSFS